jgi:signal transduction histidine kinase
VLLGDILKEIQNVFSNHVKAGNKQLILPDPPPQIHINTDFSLIIRILVNMVSNAFEATHEGGQVRITLDLTPENISFYIWNEGYIPDNIARRIFQRNFSTKNGMGRGLGTYSMKYFGEKVLGGEVDFVTSLTDGTLFRFTLPV